MTILSDLSTSAKRAMLATIEQENPLFKNIPIYLSRYGLRVWKQEKWVKDNGHHLGTTLLVDRSLYSCGLTKSI